MGDDLQHNNLQLKDKNGTTSIDGVDTKRMVTRNGNQEAEDAARLRLMEISRVVPPSDDLGDKNSVTVGTSPRTSSSPRADTDDDEVRRKLMSISYSEVDQPIAKVSQPLPT